MAVSLSRECSWSARAQDAWITLSATSGQGPATIDYTVQPNSVGTPRQGHVIVSDQTVEVVQAAAPCRFQVSPTNAVMDASAGQMSVALTATDGCRWTARGDVPWIASVVPSDGVGSATVRFSVASNTADPRAGTLTIGDAVVRVSQSAPSAEPAPPQPTPLPSPTPVPPPSPSPPPSPAPQPPPPPPAPACGYLVTPIHLSVGAAGGQASIDVSAQMGCAWTASTAAPWIAITSGSSGSGNGSVVITAAANSGAARTATVSVAGQTVTIDQAAVPAPSCTYQLSPTAQQVTSDAQNVAVALTAPAGCAWTVSSDVPWITIADPGPGTANGTFRLTVAANTGDARTGTVHAATETFTVQQAAAPCTFAIKPTFYNAGRGPDSVTIAVTTGATCAWSTVTSPDATWVTVDAGSTGVGPGTVHFLVQANSGSARSTIITIAGQPFTLHQDGVCTYSITPTFYNAGKGPDQVLINVTTDAACTWTAASTVPWATVADGASGTGPGTVHLVIQANDGPPRSVTLTIAGQPFDLKQDGK